MAGLSPYKDPARVRNPRAEYYAWKMEETERLFDELRTLWESGVPIIVEGRRDEAAVRELGVRGTIYCVKARGESRHDLLERQNGSSGTILLTDFDREGEKLEAWFY